MRDYLGNELKVGDKVIFMQINYRCFTRGEILKLGEKKATLLNSSGRKNIQFYDQIIKA